MRKTRVKGGDQHAMSVRIDNENWKWLQNEPNKNRLINDCINFIRYMEKHGEYTRKELHGNVYTKENNEIIYDYEE